MRYFVILFYLLTASSMHAQSADSVLAVARTYTIHSTVLQETRTVYISLPPGYDTISTRLPVVYVLDGEYRFLPAHGIYSYMRYWDGVPRAILVGVTNVSRQTRVRDYLPAAYQGNADNFLAFFQQELIPFVDSTFQTSNERILLGHSHGGVFALYALLKIPEVFTGFISCDPSAAGLVPAARELLRASYTGQSVYLCSSDVGAGVDENTKQAHLAGFDRLKRVLEEKHPDRLMLKFGHIADDHANSFVQGCSEGLRHVFNH